MSINTTLPAVGAHRALFEASALKADPGYFLRHNLNYPDRYHNPRTQAAYEGWALGRASISDAPPLVVEESAMKLDFHIADHSLADGCFIGVYITTKEDNDAGTSFDATDLFQIGLPVDSTKHDAIEAAVIAIINTCNSSGDASLDDSLLMCSLFI